MRRPSLFLLAALAGCVGVPFSDQNMEGGDIGDGGADGVLISTDELALPMPEAMPDVPPLEDSAPEAEAEAAAPPPGFPSCSPSTCVGCCENGVCVIAPPTDRTCGHAGQLCTDCTRNALHCNAGQCR